MEDSSSGLSHRYSRIAPATARVAGALHAAAGQMGLALEAALAAEIIDSGLAKLWGRSGPALHCFAFDRYLPRALRETGVRVDKRKALADFWFMSADPDLPSYIIQVKSGARLSKAQRTGEAMGLTYLAQILEQHRMPAVPVLCAFDAKTDAAAQKAVGSYPGVTTWCGPSLCLQLGLDYERVEERWYAFAGSTEQNDASLVEDLYASLVRQYGEEEARRMWSIDTHV